MVLYIEGYRGHRSQYVISSEDDLKQIFDNFPATRSIYNRAETLTEGVIKISQYLNSHIAHCWIEGTDDISKSLKSKAALVGLALASVFPLSSDVSSFKSGTPKPPEHTLTPKPPEHTFKIKNQTFKIREPEFGKKAEDQFLWTIREIESSGGKNTKHRLITKGPMKGQTAMGNWGLLHPTVKEMIIRMNLAGAAKPEDKALFRMTRDEMDKHFKDNPLHELRIARVLAGHVLKNQKNNLPKSSYSWLYGHNLKSSSITDEKLDDDYVKKFKKFNEKNPLVFPAAPAPSIKSFGPQPLMLSEKLMTKSQNISFSEKFKQWQKHREELENQPTRSSNFTPDPGRLREKELDEKAPSKDNIMEYLKFKLKE